MADADRAVSGALVDVQIRVALRPPGDTAGHTPMSAVMEDASMEWTRAGLTDDGFEGFRRFADLPQAGVPQVPGVYVVVRESEKPPPLLALSGAGHLAACTPSSPFTDSSSKQRITNRCFVSADHADRVSVSRLNYQRVPTLRAAPAASFGR